MEWKSIAKRFLPRLKVFRNKYVLATSIFFVYAFFLDNDDIFILLSNRNKREKVFQEKQRIEKALEDTRAELKQLNYPSEVERYAREKKYFKKDDEEIFVFSEE